ncbi:nucleotidyltransferase domain-containing protein [Streptosporangium sandarakinum]
MPPAGRLCDHVVVDDTKLEALAGRMAEVPGVVAVVLGGSRARGTHRPDSDLDLGLYYRGEPDVTALRALAVQEAGEQAELTAPGGWGPWVNGGGWLTVGGHRVDWIYRDLDRVHRIWADCREGRYEIGVQPGHPLGFYSHAYAGEVALCRVLADPGGELTDLRERTRAYPPALGDALADGMWEADFCVELARYGVSGADPAYAAGCLFRAVGVACQALHGHAGRWLINEKGMVASAGRLPAAPGGFAVRAERLLGHVGEPAERIAETVTEAATLMSEVRAAVGR